MARHMRGCSCRSKKSRKRKKGKKKKKACKRQLISKNNGLDDMLSHVQNCLTKNNARIQIVIHGVSPDHEVSKAPGSDKTGMSALQPPAVTKENNPGFVNCLENAFVIAIPCMKKPPPP